MYLDSYVTNSVRSCSWKLSCGRWRMRAGGRCWRRWPAGRRPRGTRRASWRSPRPGWRALSPSSGEGTFGVEVCDPPHRLLLVTTADERPDVLIIEATLTADGDQTILVVEERGMPLPHIADYGAGWQVHIEDLGAHLAG